MPDYRRSRLAGGTFFFTVVTEGRRDVLCHEEVRRALRAAVTQTRCARPFASLAWVLLPDHLHCVWQLPAGDADFSSRWNLIKGTTTRQLGWCGAETKSGQRRGDGHLWQRRFWEHTIRGELDLRRHVDYVHWNPVRHGLVDHPSQWPYSTFHGYCRAGVYPPSWGGGLCDGAVDTARE
jgi:putative transposase